MSIFLLILKAVLVLLPIITQLVKEGKIKTAAEKEVLDAFEKEFETRWEARIQKARDAGMAAGNANSSSVRDDNDPFDRANKSKDD